MNPLTFVLATVLLQGVQCDHQYRILVLGTWYMNRYIFRDDSMNTVISCITGTFKGVDLDNHDKAHYAATFVVIPESGKPMIHSTDTILFDGDLNNVTATYKYRYQDKDLVCHTDKMSFNEKKDIFLYRTDCHSLQMGCLSKYRNPSDEINEQLDKFCPLSNPRTRKIKNDKCDVPTENEDQNP